MKKAANFVLIFCLLLVMLPAASASVTSVKLDEAHFPDPVFRSWMSQYDYGWKEYNSWYEYTIGANDGILSFQEIANILSLNPMGSNLKGIEYLFGLKNLVCRYLKLTELDIRQNTGLIFLDCEGNDLVNIDVSSNVKLKKLICNSNDLKEIDLNFSEKPALTELLFPLRKDGL